MQTYSIILLAAGPSDRLGRPKQLLPYKESTLLEHLIDQAKNSLAKSIVVVLGANEREIKDAINSDHINISLNDEWKEGVASSIRYGIAVVQNITPETDAVILMVCDQPYVTSKLLNELIKQYEKTGKPIVTSACNNEICPPALFHQSMIPELMQLTGDNGAANIIKIHKGNTLTVPFPKGKIDINTLADYKELS